MPAPPQIRHIRMADSIDTVFSAIISTDGSRNATLPRNAESWESVTTTPLTVTLPCERIIRTAWPAAGRDPEGPTRAPGSSQNPGANNRNIRSRNATVTNGAACTAFSPLSYESLFRNLTPTSLYSLSEFTSSTEACSISVISPSTLLTR